MTVDQRTFRNALGCFASGITVVTSREADGTPVGLTVSSFCSVSLDPPLVLVCLDKGTRTLEAFRAAGTYAVNVLRADQREVSMRFASREGDKWSAVPHRDGALGLPLIDGCLAHVECVTDRIVEAGDHLVFIGRVEAVAASAGGEPLLYFRGAYGDLMGG